LRPFLFHHVNISLFCYALADVYLTALFLVTFMKVPYVGLNFAVYESLKDWLQHTNRFGLANENELHVVTRLGVELWLGLSARLLHTLLMSSREECRWLARAMLTLLLLDKAEKHSSTMA
jgi:hypothetical protein